MNKLLLKENEEIRCELIRLYLDQEHPAILDQLQEEVYKVTNHIVRGRQDVKNACIAYARRHGLVEDPPSFPVRPSLALPETKEEKDLVKRTWEQFHHTESTVEKEYAKWLDSVFQAVKGIPELNWRNDNYQKLRSIYGQIGSSVLFRDTVKRVNRTKRANPKKNPSSVPLEFHNSSLVETGQFYGNRRGIPFYNALVKVPGIKKPFLGRFRRPLPGRLVQGVTLTKKADGWYASVKCVVTKRQLPKPALQAIGVDVGQTDLVALSDGYTEHNPRDAEFIAEKAALHSKRDKSNDTNFQQVCRSKAARIDQNRKRRITHWINSALLPKLSQYSYIFIEKLPKNFKSNKGPLSCMHVILNAIKQRLGDLTKNGKLGPKSRVFEVDPAYTSQTCSYCGNSTKVSRKRKYFNCLDANCMAMLDADVNAARNILVKGLKLLNLYAGCSPRKLQLACHF